MPSNDIYVIEKWYSRGDEGTTTFRLTREQVEDALAHQGKTFSDIEDWREDLYEKLDYQSASVLSEIACSTFLVERPTFTFDQIASENGLGVESEETLWGLGTTKSAAKAALFALLADAPDEEDW